jgi:putative ABC transport system permease protein
MPGVGLISVVSGIDGSYREPENTLHADAVDPVSFFTLQSDQIAVADEQLKLLEITRTGAIVGPKIANKYGWKIGDIVTMRANGNYIQTSGSLDWSFSIVGIFDVKNPESMDQFGNRIIFHYAYLDEARLLNRGKVDMLMVKPSTSADGGTVAEAIDAEFTNSSHETRTMPMKALVLVILKQLGDIGFIINAITGAVLVTLAFMTGNAMMHSFHERIPEFAVLKTIGFSDGLVALLIAAESLTVCAIGAAMGIGGSYLLIPILRDSLHVIDLSPLGLLPGIVMALVLSMLVALTPAWWAQRLQIIDALAKG